jgi:hypothetical protein
MDTLDCRSPRRCLSCEHWLDAGCELERQLELATAPRPALLVTPIASRLIPASS